MDVQREYKTRKKIGYVLFTIGIVIILYVLFSVLLVFTGNGEVPINYFNNEENCQDYCNTSYDQIMSQVSNQTPALSLDMDEYMSDIYPMYNLMIWLSLSFILLFTGYFLCKLGFTAMSPPVAPKQGNKKGFGKKNKTNSSYQEKIESQKDNSDGYNDF